MLSIGKRLRKIIRLLLLIFYILKEIEICTAYILKINSNCEKKLILLMIPNKKKEGWHYLAIKKLSAFIKRNSTKTPR